eukprot:10074742-Alexandrium_andersonii.AAC.1
MQRSAGAVHAPLSSLGGASEMALASLCLGGPPLPTARVGLHPSCTAVTNMLVLVVKLVPMCSVDASTI